MVDFDPNDETAICILACAAAINQDLYRLIDLLNEQTRVLKRLLGKRPRPTTTERRVLAVLAHDLNRRILEAQELIVTVDTFRRWHRRLIAQTYTAKRRGHPRISRETEALIIRFARENPEWGEDSIRDRLADLGFQVSDRTVSNVLRRNGVRPAPQRRSANDWQRFLNAHWPHLAALDFATFEVPCGRGRTTRHHALYAIRLASREVRLVGVTDHADGAWMLTWLGAWSKTAASSAVCAMSSWTETRSSPGRSRPAYNRSAAAHGCSRRTHPT